MRINKSVIGGSLILLITFNIYNALNFLFQFSMARLLSIIDYGILATLFSLIYIFGIFSESIQTVITKYSVQEKNKGRLKNILNRSLKKALIFSTLLFFLYLFIAIILTYLLKIDYYLLALTGLVIFTSFLLPINRGMLLGRKMFLSLGINLNLEALLKLISAIVLVLMGWKVYGAMLATIIGLIFTFIFSFSSLKDIRNAKEKYAKTSGIYEYTTPVFIVSSVIILFYSLDILIAKVVFDSTMAGYYAIASILSKVIFLGTYPISKAMFPLSAENKDKHKKTNILLNAVIFLLFLISIALIAFYFFPDLLIKIFSGKSITQSSSILFYLGIGTSLLSLANLFILYNLSIGQTKGYNFLPLILIIEAMLLFYFSSNLLSFSIAFIAASAMFLIGSIILLRK